ncbi:MAG: cytochrome c biogenesis protein CcdA [Clostridiaceae bacterium]|nr:cytochrome c biogenesis protein CcdA [Clostridiaceae bacterium]
MHYIILFLEGIITFVSPCMLPMLPIFISYFAGGTNSRKRAFINSVFFVLGFTIVFVALGAFAGTFGRLLVVYGRWVNIVAGAIIVLFGFNYLEVINIPFLRSSKQIDYQPKDPGIISSFVFGIIFSIGWSPCVGTFLGSALMMAASSQHSLKGIFMLLIYSLGLGIPFIASAIILERLKTVFDFIKRNYKVVNLVSGLLLVMVGIAMMTGMLGRLLSVLSL